MQDVLAPEDWGSGAEHTEGSSLLTSRLWEHSNAEDPESSYRVAIPIEHRKRFGQFFTPVPIAEFMAGWIAGSHPKTILDPTVGPGVFPRVLMKRCPNANISVIDLDPVALTAARCALKDQPNIAFVQHDFLTWPDDTLFDAVIANPPYLRHHEFHYPFDIFQVIGKKNHIHLSRLSNIYVLFIVEICRRLRVGGRAAIIVPGEWVNANFGEPLKHWLLRQGLVRTFLYFSHVSTQFEDALTTASVLFLEKPERGKEPSVIRSIFVYEGIPVETVERTLRGETIHDDTVLVQTLDSETLLRERKWNDLLSHGPRGLVPGFVPISVLAKTHRGIATGSNAFFHLKPSMSQRLRLRSENLTPCIGRAGDVKGVLFSEDDFARLVTEDRRTHLFNMQSEPNEAERAYIAQGEAENLHERYLCAARKSAWFTMEKRPPAAIWAAVFGREGLRFVWNPDSVANLTTFHCVYPNNKDRTFTAALTACLNSRVVQELARQHYRVYGGGLLKFEPKDLLDIEVPDLRKAKPSTQKELADILRKLDRAIREDKSRNDVMRRLDVLVLQAANEAVQG